MTYNEDQLEQHHVELLHYINQKLKRNGGEYPLDTLVFEVGDDLEGDQKQYLSSGKVHQLLSENKDSGDRSLHDHIDTAEKNTETFITSVETVGDIPNTVSSLFQPTGDGLEGLTVPTENGKVEAEFKAQLKERGITTLNQLAKADPETVREAGEAAWRTECKDVESWDDKDITGGLFAEPESDVLIENGYDNEYDLISTPTGEIINDVGGGTTITDVAIDQAKAEIEETFGVEAFTESMADKVVNDAEVSAPIGPDLAKESLSQSRQRVEEEGKVTAVVQSIEDEQQTVGLPLVELKDDLTVEDEEAVYMSDLNFNADSPVNTGLPVLKDRPDYNRIPRPANESSGNATLPVDENGDVIKPSIPLEQDCQLPMGELVAKSLANGEVPGLEGPRGCGKNYLIKYICHKTNRGYRAFDAREDMTATDLFGPITPDEDGQLSPQNAPLKQGLLNGDVIVINEFSAMPPGIAQSLHQLMNDGEITIPPHGEHIVPHPEARIVITKNPNTIEYAGNNDLNEATKGRINLYQQRYVDSVDTETRTINKQVNGAKTYVKADTVEDIVEFAHRTREDKNDGWPTLSTRDVKNICEEIKKGVPPKGAVKKVLRKRAQTHDKLDMAFNAIGAIR